MKAAGDEFDIDLIVGEEGDENPPE
jgi:hypothetical protein